jgi:predicted ATP-grasp superfamily ATP-dependent carboligase
LPNFIDFSRRYTLSRGAKFQLIKKQFDANSCQKTLDCIFESWLPGAEAIGLGLYEKTLNADESARRQKELEGELKREREKNKKLEKNLSDFVSPLFNSAPESDRDREDLIAALRSNAEGLGYSSPAAGVSAGRQKRIETWREEMLKLYKTYGVVEPGDEVEVVEEAILIDGAVSQRGLVRKRKVTKNG